MSNNFPHFFLVHILNLMYSIITFLIVTINITLHVEKNYKKEHVKDIFSFSYGYFSQKK